MTRPPDPQNPTADPASPNAVPSQTSPEPPPHTAVVGLQWGDEGKGKIVDWLTEDFDMVVRFNGGANAGHSVVIGETRFALHLVPCGILRPDRLNVIANGVVLDPVVLAEEIAGLRAQGVAVGENLKISDRAHLVMPYHKAEDRLREAALARAAGQAQPIGTTGRGIGPCYADKALRAGAIRVADLYATGLPDQVRRIAALKNATLGALAELAGEPWPAIDPATLVTDLAAQAEQLRPHVADTVALLHESMAAGRRILFEGGNGSLLDIDHGSFPYVTSSSTTALGIYPGAGIPGGRLGRILGVVKAYATRVGGGPFPTEQDNAVGEHLRTRGREFGTTTGRPRRCGWLDLVAVRHSARLSGATELAVMLLDVPAGLERLRVCTAYRLDGRALDRMPASAEDLARVEPVYRELPGFAGDLGACRSYAELPAAARDYLDLIEQEVGVPVTIASVGPARAATLRRGEGVGGAPGPI